MRTPISWYQVKKDILQPALPVLTLSEGIAQQRKALLSGSSEALVEKIMADFQERPDVEALKVELLAALEAWKLKQRQTLP
jgi:hypothetical protein